MQSQPRLGTNGFQTQVLTTPPIMPSMQAVRISCDFSNGSWSNVTRPTHPLRELSPFSMPLIPQSRFCPFERQRRAAGRTRWAQSNRLERMMVASPRNPITPAHVFRTPGKCGHNSLGEAFHACCCCLERGELQVEHARPTESLQQPESATRLANDQLIARILLPLPSPEITGGINVGQRHSRSVEHMIVS